jgi:1-acyl-sn-glycerol-3-phosphate acyltransferase
VKKELPNAHAGSYKAWAREIFEWFVLRMMRRDFAGVVLWGPRYAVPQDVPVLFVANHVSWWDGFFLWRLQRMLYPERPIYSVMLAREFSRTFWFKWVGILPIEQGRTASLRALLQRLAQLVRETSKDSFICSFFPQGVIKPSFARPLSFAEGLRGVAQAMAPVTIIPLGIHIEPLCDRRPHAFVTMGSPINHEKGRLDVGSIECLVTSVLDALLKDLSLRGEQILDRDNQGGQEYVSLV